MLGGLLSFPVAVFVTACHSPSLSVTVCHCLSVPSAEACRPEAPQKYLPYWEFFSHASLMRSHMGKRLESGRPLPCTPDHNLTTILTTNGVQIRFSQFHQIPKSPVVIDFSGVRFLFFCVMSQIRILSPRPSILQKLLLEDFFVPKCPLFALMSAR